MTLSLQSFASLVQSQAAAAQASASAVLNFTVGSVIRAIIEANASIMLWAQWLILQVLSLTRAASSVGTDLDSWMADFSFTRLPATYATGQVTLSRFTPTSTVQIAPGAQVKTADGTQTFTVIADTTQSLWNAGLGVYVLPGGTASGNVTVVAVNPGTQGNVGASTITLIASSISVDTVNNASAFTNGINAESDASFRARFSLYIAGLSEATVAAVGSAIAGVQQGLTYGIAVNVDPLGNYKPGNFVVTIDDGTGYPSSALQSLVYTAVNNVRALAETFSVQAPTVTTVNISMTLTASPGYIKANMQGPLAAAVSAYIDALPVGSSLYYTRLAQVVYDAIPGIASITGLIANGGTADISVAASGVLKPGTVTVN